MTTFFTGKGDGGTTTLFGKKDRVAKNDAIFDALGTIDELNSYVGYIVANSPRVDMGFLLSVQDNLFVIQAQLAGAEKAIEQRHVQKLTDAIKELQDTAELKQESFVLPGGTPLASMLDVARTITRRAERAVVAVHDYKNENILSYLNRLSSFFYVYARYENKVSKMDEVVPVYE